MQAVIILSNTSIDDYYDHIKYSLDQRFHNYQPHFPEYPISETEYGDLETYSSYADHASDNLYVNGVHVERLIK